MMVTQFMFAGIQDGHGRAKKKPNLKNLAATLGCGRIRV
jgi:hypothetical protein